MKIYHQQLAAGRWFELYLIEQLANIGSEVVRAISWRNKKNPEYANNAFERSLELFDLTLQDPKNKKRLREVARAREIWVDYFFGDNQYNSTAEFWNKYFYSFAYAAKMRKNKSSKL